MLVNSDGFNNDIQLTDKTKTKNKFIIYFFVLVSIVFSIFVLTSSSTIETTKEIKEDYKIKKLDYLKNKIKSFKLSDNEMIEFCKYSEELENIIYLECHCDGENMFIDDSGIHWLDPPNPEDLKNYDYIELPRNVNDTSKRRIFINENKKLRIGFDLNHPSGNRYEESPPHYHRYYSFEESKEDKNKYLDECGDLVKKGSKASHLYFKGNKVLKRLFKWEKSFQVN